MIEVFLKWFLIGFAIAAPVGPIGILCISRSLHHGLKIGLATGLGAAFADGAYGFIAGFGLTAISSFLIDHKHTIQLLGGLFLLYLGIKIIFSPSHHQDTKNPDKNDNKKSLLHASSTTFILTLSNPTTIMSFIAIFAGLGIGTIHTNYMSSSLMVIGVIMGSGLWWLLLSTLVACIFRDKISAHIMQKIKILSGAIILLFGVVSIVSIFS